MKNKDELVKYLQTQNEVKVAYLFGTAAKGRMGKLSDVDIGVLLEEGLSKDEMLEIQLRLICDLKPILKTDKIDLVIINDAPLLLRYNIVKDGELLKSYERERVEFERSVLLEYLDMGCLITRHTEQTIKRIAREGLA